jgi:hypothetical protein
MAAAAADGAAAVADEGVAVVARGWAGAVAAVERGWAAAACRGPRHQRDDHRRSVRHPRVPPALLRAPRARLRVLRLALGPEAQDRRLDLLPDYRLAAGRVPSISALRLARAGQPRDLHRELGPRLGPDRESVNCQPVSDPVVQALLVRELAAVRQQEGRILAGLAVQAWAAGQASDRGRESASCPPANAQAEARSQVQLAQARRYCPDWGIAQVAV